MKMVKVVYSPEIFTTESRGGISRYFAELAYALNEKAEVSIYAGINQSEIATELAKGGVRVIGRTFRAPRPVDRVLRVMNEALYLLDSRFSSHIVHHTMYPLLARGRQSRHVITIHDMIWERQGNTSAFSSLNSVLKGRAAHQADQIITPTLATANLVRDMLKVPEDRVTVIRHGVRRISNIESQDYLEKRPYILYVGKRNGYKGFQTLVLAYGSLLGLATDLDLICVGGGAFTRSELDQFSKAGLARPPVIVSPSDRELLFLYKHAVGVIIPSKEEGFGFVGLEAMLARCPVIATDIPCFKEVYSHYYKDFRTDKTDDLVDRIRELIQSPPDPIYLSRAESHAETFTWEQSASKHLEIYRGLE